MPDIYLCGNKSDTATDITLRGVNACEGPGGAAAYGRIAAPPRRATSLVQVLVTITGQGAIAASGDLDTKVTPDAHPVGITATHSTTVALTTDHRGVFTSSRTLDLTAVVSGDDPSADDLLLLDLL